MPALTFPGSPTNGQVYDRFKFNSTRGVWEKNPYAIVSGGNSEVTYTDANGQDWYAHIFTSSGTLTVTTPGRLDTLCVGGGGSSSAYYGHQSGGGAGAIRWGWFEYDTAGDYTIIVGGDTSITKPSSTDFVIASGRGDHGSGTNGNGVGLSGYGGGGSPGGVSRNGGTQSGGGAGGLLFGGPNAKEGIDLDYLTGTPTELGHAGDNAQSNAQMLARGYGSGGGDNQWSSGHGGRPGVVVVRYKV